MSQHKSSHPRPTLFGRSICSICSFSAMVHVDLDCSSFPIHASVIRWSPIRLKAIFRQKILENFQLRYLRAALESLTAKEI